MKHLIFTLAISLCFYISSATVLRVNNNPGNSAPYNNAAAAYYAAAVDDTIYLEGSSIYYNIPSPNKKLVWIGNGYFIGIGGNNNLGLQYNPNESTINCWIVIGAGAEGSTFMGLNFHDYYCGTALYPFIQITTNNITFKRCKIMLGIGLSQASSDFIISESYVIGSFFSYGPSNQNPISYTLSNNYFSNGISLASNYYGVIVRNNYLGANSSIGFGLYENNIINNTGDAIICTNPANVSNNIFMNQTNTNYVGSNGNIFVNENPGVTNSVFINAASDSYDSWMKLKVGSPAIGSGIGGIDMGPFGGTLPYRLSGIPPIPTIYGFTTNSTSGNLLPCTISTRSNN